MARAGLLRKKIDIYRITTEANNLGEPVKTWVEFAINRWARVEPLAGREFFLAQQTASRINTRFTMRYLIGVKAKMKVVYGGNDYNIESVVNVDEENRELQLLCSRIE